MFSIHLLLSDYQYIYFYHLYLPSLGAMVSVMFQDSADGITAHYCMHGRWLRFGRTVGCDTIEQSGLRGEATRYKWQWHAELGSQQWWVDLLALSSIGGNKSDTREIATDGLGVIQTQLCWWQVSIVVIGANAKNNGMPLDVHATARPWALVSAQESVQIFITLMMIQKVFLFLVPWGERKKKKGLSNDKTIVASLLNDVALCNNVVRFEKICIFSKANIK